MGVIPLNVSAAKPHCLMYLLNSRRYYYDHVCMLHTHTHTLIIESIKHIDMSLTGLLSLYLKFFNISIFM